MKKYIFLAALMGIGLSSCSSEHEDAMADDITEADVFVASEQFQEFQQVMQKDDLMMKKKLKKLNKSERIYCIMQAEINKEVCDANCEDYL